MILIRWIGEWLYFVAVHPCSTLSDCCQLATTLNAEVQKRQNLGDRINRSRRNLARKRTPWVCYSAPNFRDFSTPPQGELTLPTFYVHALPDQFELVTPPWGSNLGQMPMLLQHASLSTCRLVSVSRRFMSTRVRRKFCGCSCTVWHS